MRTLTYADIKAGKKKAGPLPEWNAEPLVFLAWLSAAGYGRACLPSLRRYLAFQRYLGGNKSALTGKQLRRATMLPAKIAKALEIQYPPPKSKTWLRTGMKHSRYSPTSLSDRLAAFHDAGGLFVSAALKAYQGRPSWSRIVGICTPKKLSSGDVPTLSLLICRKLGNFSLVVDIPLISGYWKTRKCLHRELHISTTPIQFFVSRDTVM